MRNNEDRKVCGECGGRCCKKLPGGAFPADFGNTVAKVKKAVLAALATGNWSIDWYDGDPGGGDADRGPFVRPATLEGRGQLGDPSWGGVCCLLGDDGCTLAFDERPTVCRELVPDASTECDCPIGKADLALAWKSYWPWLEEQLGDEYWYGTGTHDNPLGGLFGWFDEEW